ncbi:MAG: hypothetical protein QM527_07225 [Alphaproteobacteria bacterium]|nr:hypothetical protein [Alphaproteobacteria bacterium]
MVLGCVVWVGSLAYSEGQKTEQTKRHGEAWLAWLQESNPEREKAEFEPSACSRQTGRTWGGCLQALTDQDLPLTHQINAFTGQPVTWAPKCDFQDRSLVGVLVLEKLNPTPPGSAVPFVVTPMSPSDPIASAMGVRLTVCDKGAGPIKIGETEF